LVPSDAPLVLAASPSVAVATLAFLVVFSALINDFFSMDILGSFNLLEILYFNPRSTTYLDADGMPKYVVQWGLSALFRVNELQHWTWRPVGKAVQKINLG
jgi:hypothetical protein